LAVKSLTIMEANPKEQTTITPEQLQSLLDRVRQGKLVDGDLQLIEKLIVLDIKLFSLLKKKRTTLKQLREFVFGAEKTEKVKDGEEQKVETAESDKEKEKKPRAPGHGRNSSEDYTGAKRVHCTDEELKIGSA
jgi:hypothetical protein